MKFPKEICLNGRYVPMDGMARLLWYFIILPLILQSVSASSADRPSGRSRADRLRCSSFFSDASPGSHPVPLKRTLGVEWEFSPVNFEVDSNDTDSFFSMHAMGAAYDSELAKSKFRNLFAFFGKDPSGEWLENLIPPEIVSTQNFLKLRETPGVRFEVRNGQTYLKNYRALDTNQFRTVLRGLMEARGKAGDSLKLKKIPTAWAKKKNRFDQMISENVAEEWRGDKFQGIEFPMHGSVEAGSDIRGYIKNLWVRLGLFRVGDPKLETALDQANGHVHWVADVQSLPEEQRQKVYEAIIGYWGDANDWAHVKHINAYKNLVRPDGSVLLNQDLAKQTWTGFFQNYKQYSITVLTKDTYNRLSAKPQGILVRDRAADLNPAVDPNMPPIFKRLQFGLRGIYGQSSLEGGKPIPIVGIEARNMPTVSENIRALPVKTKGPPQVDVPALLRYSSKDSRGLEGSEEALGQRAEILGVNPSIVDDLSNVISDRDDNRLPNHKWLPNQVRANFFLPMNDWLAHPAVKRNLAKMPADEQKSAIARYNQALQRFIDRINKLAFARNHPRAQYQPDWTTPLKEFPDGINRVYPRKEFPEVVLPGGWHSAPDQWFLIILASENCRFVAESDLARLLQLT